ncbi:cadherin-like domain-containing protein, partial [Rhizobium alvei]
AIYFEAGTNLLDIQGGSITGNVQADGTDDTLRLSGASGGSFDVSTIGSSAQYRGFEHLGSAGSGTWTLTGTNAATQSWSASAGTLLVDGTIENTDFTIGSGAMLGGSGTVGDVTIQSGGTIGPGNSPGILTVADLTISGTFDVEISGTIVGTEFYQIVVTGSVTLSGTLDVSFLNAYLPTVGDSFTIIDNQGSDAVTGTFSGLTDGAYFSVGGTYFQIDYDGGTSNDVVLTAIDDGPTESANAGVTVAEGGTVTVAAADLAFADINQTADNLVYTITSAVTNGTLFLNGVALDLNDTFTQDDIDDGLVTYTHDGGETTSASFGFSISDGQGNDVTGQSFAFTVTAVNEAPTDIVLAPRRTLPGGATAVNENVKGAVIGRLSFTDPDTGDTVTYTVDDNRFEIVNDRLRLKSGTSLDYEKEHTVDLTITAEDADGLAYDETFSIHVIDRVDVKVGSAGNDRVIGTEGNDRLYGRQGNDVLKGLGGDDRLRSKLGDDRLWGGDGADTFVFMHNGGHDRIMDFETGIDTINLARWPEIANFADVKSHAYMQDGDLWIEAGRDALILKDFHKRDLDAGDFLFAS